MDVFTHSPVIAGNGDDDLPSLVDGVRHGRPAALERLVARIEQRVRVWAGRYTEDDDAAEDVAQDVLIDLERRVQKFDGASRFSTWLFAVTRNVALTRQRREQRRSDLFARRMQDEVRDEQVVADPDTAAIAQLALTYFDALPRRQRQIFELADIRGLTPAEIARELDMEQVTVRAHLFKARRAIRAKLLENHERLMQEYRS